MTSVLLLAVSTWAPAWADNRTLVFEFDGSQASMPISVPSQVGCFNPPALLPYHDLGVITVDQAGEYRAADISPTSEGLPAVGAVESVLFLYQGAFDPLNPESNRVAIFDYAARNWVNDEDYVSLDAATEYRVVIQAGCSADPGLAGFVMRGPGDISGTASGSPTPPDYHGDFSGIATFADFPEWGTHKYRSFKYTAPKNGYYWFLDIGYGWEGASWVDQRIYAGSFDPVNPADKLISANISRGFKLYLDAGTEIEVVNVDTFDSDSVFQMVILPPGELQGFNPAFTGAFGDPDVPKQGLLIETDEVFNIVFLAMFVFDDDPAAEVKETPVGSSDQRWLTAFGSFTYDSTVVSLSFENTSGGRFNSGDPEAGQNPSYGSGTLTAMDCDHMLLEYSLPGTPDGSMNMMRLLPGKGRICAEWVWVGSPIE